MKRREFLTHTAAFSLISVAGGLRIVKAGSAESTALRSPDWVLSISSSGQVVFTSPFTEMGQGSPTAASMIIADELDTDLDQLQVRNHDGLIVLTDPTFGPRFNGGGSGGSQSMATGWPALRAIGATARTMLIEAAAQAWVVDASECDTAIDCVEHSASGRRLTYGELVTSAAALPLAETPRYRPADDYRYIGRSRKRPDTKQILTGQADFASDQKLPDMLYASIQRSPFIAGKKISYRKEQARAVPGVVDVFRIEPGEFEKAAKSGVVVLGKDTWSTLQGRRKLQDKWQDEKPAYEDEADFWSVMERQLRRGAPNGELTVGDFDGVDLDGLQDMAASYRLGYQNQTPMEPIAMTAHHKGDSFELWTGTQYPSDFRERIAEMTGFEQDKIKLHNTIMGGSFGRKYVRDGLTELVMIADRVRRPVKLVWTREDDIRSGQFRNASLTNLQAHFDQQGTVKRWFQSAVQTAADDPSEVASLGSGMSDQPYRFDPARFEMTGVRANVNLGPMRSPPHPAKLFPTVCFIDELAHRLGEDPIDLHLRLVGEPREIPQTEWLSGNGHTDNTAAYIQVAQAVRQLSRWDEPLAPGHGKGFSMAYIFGTHVGMVVETAWRDKMISIEKVWCSVNCGRVINPDVARQQVEGGVIYGLSGAMGEVITTTGGAVRQGNFHNYPIMRYSQAPDIEVEFISSDERPSGLGEPATPPAYPALANAIFATTGQRIREIPLNRHIEFARSRKFS